ncbi:MAG: hypothetical protein ACRCT2_01660, partial [Plesiomonas shigelloides]
DSQPPPTSRIAGSRWTVEEEELLRTSANTCWTSKMLKKDLAVKVRTFLPHQTADALLKRLTALKWIPPPEDLLDPIHQVHLPPTQSPSRMPSPRPTRTAGSSRMEEEDD